MAHSRINFEKNGVIKAAPVGFSWTVFFFSGFPPLIRGHIMMGVIIFVLAGFTFSISSIVFAFFYNKMYISYLLGKGFRFYEVVNGKSKKEIEASLGMELNIR